MVLHIEEQPAFQASGQLKNSEELKGARRMEKMGEALRRVLLVDDEEMVLEMTTAMLDHLGYEVVCAGTGDLALDLYRKTPFDLIILDLTLKGGLGGMETMARLSAIDPAVRVVLSTGYTVDSAVEDFESYGFAGVITKPYELEGLARALEGIFSDHDGNGG
jgi:two-component system, cell cycle sensor histidine kinase and response regulator CckA